MPRMLTITFHGLCLFAPSRDGMRYHVFLVQPLDAEHRTVRCYQRANSSWTGEEVARGSSFEFGIVNSEVGIPEQRRKVTMPGKDEMANVADIAGNDALSEAEAVASKVDERGSHIILHGGTLTVIDEIGFWMIDGDSSKKHPLPHMVQWTGEVEDTDQSGWMEFWNAMKDETPEPVRCNTIPASKLTEEEAEERGRNHVKAYYKIVGGKRPKLCFKEKKHAKSTCAPPRAMPTPVHTKTIIVSSCPSMAITLGG